LAISTTKMNFYFSIDFLYQDNLLPIFAAENLVRVLLSAKIGHGSANPLGRAIVVPFRVALHMHSPYPATHTHIHTHTRAPPLILRYSKLVTTLAPHSQMWAGEDGRCTPSHHRPSFKSGGSKIPGGGGGKHQTPLKRKGGVGAATVKGG